MSLTNSQSCPTCRIYLSAQNLSETLIVRNIVNSLTVYCDNRCGWTGPLDDIDAHIASNCPSVRVKCGSFDSYECFCDGTVLRGEVVKHVEDFQKKLEWYLMQAQSFSEISVNGWNTIIKPNGSVYKVQTSDQGEGALKSIDGKVYCGQWLEGHQDGLGVLLWGKKNSYIGQFANGEMSGRGVHRFDNGSEYRGKFVDGAYCDTEGRLNLADQSTYVGGFVDGKYHGKGTLTRAGDTYSGQWANGKTQGKCVVKHSHGTSYIGELVDFKRRGRGALYNARNQLVYDGDLFDGWKHGTGSWTYPNKDVYSGTLDHDKRHGFGVMKYANGSKYEGEWSHDLREGQGVMTGLNGAVYQGSFVADKRCGQGVMFYSSGNVFEGMWADDKMHGEGVMKYDNGSVYVGSWFEGGLHGTGRMEYSDGDVYTGSFVHGDKSGEGHMKYSNGDEYRGQWLCFRRHGKRLMVVFTLQRGVMMQFLVISSLFVLSVVTCFVANELLIVK